MTNHPNRGKPSREALELISHFARHGIALDWQQQDAVATICRFGKRYLALQIERCNGDWPVRKVDQDEWVAQIERKEALAGAKIMEAAKLLPGVFSVELGGDPRGATVKLVMLPEFHRLHDSFGGDGLCVPGS